MIYLLVGYLLALLASLFFSSWRMAIWATALESFVVGLAAARSEGLESWSVRIQVIDFAVFRAMVVPVVLVAILKKYRKERDFDTIPANFVIWTSALVVFIASFWFGQKMFPADLPRSIHGGTATAGVLTGLFILANQASATGQLIGLLTMESGILLTETLGAGHEHWIIQLGLSASFVWTIAVLFGFLRRLPELDAGKTEVVATDGIRAMEEGDAL